MKKLIFIIIFIPTIIYSDVLTNYLQRILNSDNFSIENQVKFKIQENSEYEFKIILRPYHRYYFKLLGENNFRFKFCVVNGNNNVVKYSNNNKLLYKEKIFYDNTYVIKVYSEKENFITLYYGEY